MYKEVFLKYTFVARLQHLIYNILHDIISIKKTQITKHRKKD